MGRGHRPAPRSQESFRRKPPRLSGDLILIVCEGEKTEPNYFNDLKRRLKIHPMQVAVYGKECGPDPLSVVNFARNKRKDSARNGLRYDQVWCVVDKDAHTNLAEAVNMAEANKCKVCLSVPSFEFWYLLHFTYTTRPFVNADAVIQELKKYLKNHAYLKNSPPMDELMPRLEEAITHSERVRKNSKRTRQGNPGTDVNLLISELKLIRDGSRIT